MQAVPRGAAAKGKRMQRNLKKIEKSSWQRPASVVYWAS